VSPVSFADRNLAHGSLSGAAAWAEEALYKIIDLPPWRRRVRKRQIAVNAFVRRGVHVHHDTVGGERPMQQVGHPCPIHPVEGLCQGHRAERTQVRREVFGPQVHPAHVGDPGSFSLSRRLGQHLGIGVQARCLFEPRSE
jgi:hypothetical protein